jgi:hypothetical protein
MNEKKTIGDVISTEILDSNTLRQGEYFVGFKADSLAKGYNLLEAQDYLKHANNLFSSLANKIFEHFTTETTGGPEEHIRTRISLYYKLWRRSFYAVCKKFPNIINILKIAYPLDHNERFDLWFRSFETTIISEYLVNAINSERRYIYTLIIDQLIRDDKDVEIHLERLKEIHDRNNDEKRSMT